MEIPAHLSVQLILCAHAKTKPVGNVPVPATQPARDPEDKPRWAEGSKGVFTLCERVSQGTAAGKAGARGGSWCLWTQCRSAARVCVKSHSKSENKTRPTVEREACPSLCGKESHFVLAELPKLRSHISDCALFPHSNTCTSACVLYPVGWTAQC